jgi:hypothetical protein
MILTANYAQRISRATAATPLEPRHTSVGLARSVAATRSKEPRLIRGFDGKAMGVEPGL